MNAEPSASPETHTAPASRKPAVQPRALPVYELTITLLETAPPIWRRLRVPGSIRLSKLHRCLQTAMGWQDYHLHEFRIGSSFYGFPDDEYFDPKHIVQDDSRVRLQAVAPTAPAAFVYEYDFGDCWQHLILVEHILWPRDKLPHPICLAGERACPPEDCGGISGYGDFLEVIADPTHEEHEEMVAWAGGSYDPSYFDSEAVNLALARSRACAKPPRSHVPSPRRLPHR